MCRICGAPAEPGGYAVGLCATHRTALARRPLPAWIKVSAAGIVALVVVSMLELQPGIAAGVAYVRGERATSAGRHAEAAARYDEVLARYPESTKALMRSFIAHAKAGQRQDARSRLDTIVKRNPSVDKELAADFRDAVRAVEGGL